MGRVLDVPSAAVRVNGEPRTRARVIWQEDKLYIFTTGGVEVFDAEAPVKEGNLWVTGDVTFERSGCSCGFALARKPRRTLLAGVVAA